MQISQNSWHFRLNMNVQGGAFYDKLLHRQLTTCTYIRTTLRSLVQGASFALFVVLFTTMALAMALNALYSPLALIFGWPVHPNLCAGCGSGFAHHWCHR